MPADDMLEVAGEEVQVSIHRCISVAPNSFALALVTATWWES